MKKKSSGKPYTVTAGGRIQTQVAAFGGGVTGTPPGPSRYSEPGKPSGAVLRRPGGAKSGGGNINSVTGNKKGGK